MRLLCIWRQRALSHYAALGRSLPQSSSLGTHVLHCESCRRCWEPRSPKEPHIDPLRIIK